MGRATSSALSLLALLLGAGATDSSAGCRAAPPAQLGVTSRFSITVPEPAVQGGRQARSFLLRLPRGYSANQAVPLVMDIHGYTSHSWKQHNHSGYTDIADEHNFIGVWPDGSNDCPTKTQGWNALGASAGTGPLGETCDTDRRAWGEYECYDSCGARCAPKPPENYTGTCISSSCWNDVGFIEQLLDWLEASVCLDRDRVHVTGLSNGAMMTYQVAHSLSDRVASIVPVAALPLLGHLPDALPSRPMAVLAINGLFDGIIPANFSNGFLGRAGPHGSTWSQDGFFYTPLANLTRALGQINKCGSERELRVFSTPRDGDMHWSADGGWRLAHAGGAGIALSRWEDACPGRR